MRVDHLFYNGKFFISPYLRRRVNWLAVQYGRVVAYGEGAPDRSLLYQHRTNLENKRVMPGWIDAHVHLLNLGLRAQEIDVSHCTSPQSLVSLLKSKIPRRSAHAQKWVEAYGLDNEKFKNKEEVTARDLDQVSRHIPIVVRRVDEHALFVNSAVLRASGVQYLDLEIPGGQILRDQHGYATGVFIDKAMEYILRMKPVPTQEVMKRALMGAQRLLIRNGITSVHDMAMQRLPLEVLIELMKQDLYDLRVYCALYGDEAFETFSEPKDHLFQNHLSIQARKIFVDGTLGSRGAWLSKPYADKPDWVGSNVCDTKEVLKAIHMALQKRFQLCFHTLGDEASRWVLDLISKQYRPEQLSEKRFRLEHLEVFDSAYLSVMRDYGFIASMQPWHALSDEPWLEKRLGRDRFHEVSPLKGILSKGIPVCGGSDTPVEPHDPLKGIYAAVCRRPPRGKKDWLFEHKISLMDAIGLYTMAGAFAEFSEHLKGTLDIGKLSDFVVLSEDMFHINPRYLPDVKCHMTVIGGRIVYPE